MKKNVLLLGMLFTLTMQVQSMNRDTILLVASFMRNNNDLANNVLPDLIMLNRGNVEERSIAALMCVNKFYNEELSKKYCVRYVLSYVEALEYAAADQFVTCNKSLCYLPVHMLLHGSNNNLLNKKIVDIVLKLPGLKINIEILFLVNTEKDCDYGKDWKLECQVLCQQIEGQYSNHLVSRIKNMLKISNDNGNDNDYFTFCESTLSYLAYCFNKKPCERDFFCYFFSRCFNKYGMFHQLMKLIKKNKKDITLQEMLLVNDIKNSINEGLFGRYYSHKEIGKLTRKNIVHYLKVYIPNKPSMKKEDFENNFLEINKTLEYKVIFNALLQGMRDHWISDSTTQYCVKKVEKLCENYIVDSLLSDPRYEYYAHFNATIITGRGTIYYSIPKKIMPFLNQTINYYLDIPLGKVLSDKEPVIGEKYDIQESPDKEKVDYNTIINWMKRYRFVYKWGMRSVGLLFFIGTCKFLWALS